MAHAQQGKARGGSRVKGHPKSLAPRTVRLHARGNLKAGAKGAVRQHPKCRQGEPRVHCSDPGCCVLLHVCHLSAALEDFGNSTVLTALSPEEHSSKHSTTTLGVQRVGLRIRLHLFPPEFSLNTDSFPRCFLC